MFQHTKHQCALFISHILVIFLYKFVAFRGVDIGTMQIIEKGSWDEVFSINGGGHVHLKLDFTLSEDDRNRIRVMVLFSIQTFFYLVLVVQEVFLNHKPNYNDLLIA